MPYTIDRGVRIYYDNDTPPEYATGADEDQAAFNTAADEAFKAGEELAGLLDLLTCAHGVESVGMIALRSKVAALIGEAKALLSAARD